MDLMLGRCSERPPVSKKTHARGDQDELSAILIFCEQRQTGQRFRSCRQARAVRPAFDCPETRQNLPTSPSQIPRYLQPPQEQEWGWAILDHRPVLRMVCEPSPAPMVWT